MRKLIWAIAITLPFLANLGWALNGYADEYVLLDRYFHKFYEEQMEGQAYASRLILFNSVKKANMFLKSAIVDGTGEKSKIKNALLTLFAYDLPSSLREQEDKFAEEILEFLRKEEMAIYAIPTSIIKNQQTISISADCGVASPDISLVLVDPRQMRPYTPQMVIAYAISSDVCD